MTYLSMTRLRLRSPLYLLPFALYTFRSVRQAQRTPGFLQGKIMFTADLAGWTALLWKSEAAIRAYVSAGAHGEAMNYTQQWASEAVHGHQVMDFARVAGTELPSWGAIAQSLSENGHFYSLPYPSVNHQKQVVPQPGFTFFHKSILPLAAPLSETTHV
ncbi:MAG: hypothetical protein AB4042_16495 [Leptolyngbyaceae cyanobacterium]